MHPLITQAVDEGMQLSQVRLVRPVDLGCRCLAQAQLNSRLDQQQESALITNASRVVEHEEGGAAQNSCREVAPLRLDLRGRLLAGGAALNSCSKVAPLGLDLRGRLLLLVESVP